MLEAGINWLTTATVFTIIISIFVLLPMSFVPFVRGFAGGALVTASYLFGLTTLVMSMMMVYHLWGGFWLAIGLLFAGIGPVPMAVVAMSLKGMWSPVFQLLFFIVMTLVVRFYGIRVVTKAEDRRRAVASSR